MPERITIPFKYIGDIGKCSLMPIGEELTPLQQLSKKVLENKAYFRVLPLANQEIGLQALSTLGAYAVSKCDGKWSSSRWQEIWDELNIDAIGIIKMGARATSEGTMRNGFMNLFQMLECGVNTKEELDRIKIHNKHTMLASQVTITQGVRTGIEQARVHSQRVRNKAV